MPPSHSVPGAKISGVDNEECLGNTPQSIPHGATPSGPRPLSPQPCPSFTLNPGNWASLYLFEHANRHSPGSWSLSCILLFSRNILSQELHFSLTSTLFKYHLPSKAFSVHPKIVVPFPQRLLFSFSVFFLHSTYQLPKYYTTHCLIWILSMSHTRK